MRPLHVAAERQWQRYLRQRAYKERCETRRIGRMLRRSEREAELAGAEFVRLPDAQLAFDLEASPVFGNWRPTRASKRHSGNQKIRRLNGGRSGAGTEEGQPIDADFSQVLLDAGQPDPTQHP